MNFKKKRDLLKKIILYDGNGFFKLSTKNLIKLYEQSKRFFNFVLIAYCWHLWNSNAKDIITLAKIKRLIKNDKYI